MHSRGEQSMLGPLELEIQASVEGLGLGHPSLPPGYVDQEIPNT